MDSKLMIYPKEDIPNSIGNTLYIKDKAYEAYRVNKHEWLIKCDLTENEHPIVSWKFIEENFIFNKNCG